MLVGWMRGCGKERNQGSVLSNRMEKGINHQGITKAEKISGERDLVREASSFLDTWHSLGKKNSK